MTLGKLDIEKAQDITLEYVRRTLEVLETIVEEKTTSKDERLQAAQMVHSFVTLLIVAQLTKDGQTNESDALRHLINTMGTER
jgi:hypothetical protein